jgi:putative transposase
VRLTHNQRNWGFDLCFLYLRNVKGYPWNHKRVVRALDQIIEWRGKPIQIRCNNGPEYISATLAAWAEKQGITLVFIQPGNPQQNAYIERYKRTVRYDLLAQYLFHSIEEVQEYATRWLWTYNNEQPNMALGGDYPSTLTSG